MNTQGKNVKNDIYKSEDLLKKYSVERNRWEDFYESERVIMDMILKDYSSFSLLDAGCGCGGLLKALEERHYKIQYYKGVDINEQMISFANTRKDFITDHEFECADISFLDESKTYDIVVSLSCVDWNNDVLGMIQKCWQRVSKGGWLIASFRVTNLESVISGAFQYLDSGDERYNYVVFNLKDLIGILTSLTPQPVDIDCYGYWGSPSATAVIDYDRICFSVFALHKPEHNIDFIPRIHMDLPMDVVFD